MEMQEKEKLVKELNEADLREKLLIPLFNKIGFIDPVLYHHANEKGKDIVLKEFDNKFKKTSYISVVVKAGDVTGAASGSSSYFTLLNQIKQSLNESYKHVYELREVDIDQVIIVVSGRILPTALESVYGTLKADRLDKAIREVIDLAKLIGLVDNYFPEFWNEYFNEKESLLLQRNYLLNNLTKLSKVLFGNDKDQEVFLSKVSKSDIDIKLFPFESTKRFVANTRYNQVDLDEIDEYYSDNCITNNYDDIKKHFFGIKTDAEKILQNIDEVIDILKAILAEKNPEKIIDLTFEFDSYVGSGYGNQLSFSTYDLPHQDEYFTVIREYREKKELLIDARMYDFYKDVHYKISDYAYEELLAFFNKDILNKNKIWLGLEIQIDIFKKELLNINHYILDETIEVSENKVKSNVKRREDEKISRHNDNVIKIEIVVSSYNSWNEYTSERKAKNALWRYERAFEKMFFEILGYSNE